MFFFVELRMLIAVSQEEDVTSNQNQRTDLKVASLVISASLLLPLPTRQLLKAGSRRPYIRGLTAEEVLQNTAVKQLCKLCKLSKLCKL